MGSYSDDADLFRLSIDDVYFEAGPLPARIQLSDPQIFARETLVNDRRREALHIETLIKDSPNQKFVPQLRRELGAGLGARAAARDSCALQFDERLPRHYPRPA